MALGKDIYGSVGTPRIYIDYVQYAKAIDYVKFYYGRDFYNVNGTYADAWDFNPAKTTTYQASGEEARAELGVIFKNSDADIPDEGDNGDGIPPAQDSLRDNQFRLLLSTINYGGLLNHDLGIFFNNANNADIRSIYFGTTRGDSSNSVIVGNIHSVNDIGYTLFDINSFSEAGTHNYEGLYFQILNEVQDFQSGELSGFGDTEPFLNLGTLTVGRYFDFPVNPDLNVSMSFDYSGIKSFKNISGDEITSINYHQSPNWGNLAPWTNVNLDEYEDFPSYDLAGTWVNSDFRAVRRGGRRTFKLSFSYIDKEDMFPKNFEGNMAGDYESVSMGGGEMTAFTWDEDSSIVSSFLNFTLGGQIPFIFQPDNTKQDFAICKLDKASSTIKQVAHGVYSVSMVFVETW